MGFKARLVQDFNTKLPGVRSPGKNIIKKMWGKQMRLGTVLNCKSRSSPVDTYTVSPSPASNYILHHDYLSLYTLKNLPSLFYTMLVITFLLRAWEEAMNVKLR